jgi:glucose-6-phosphate 1-epimerase
VVWSPYGNEGMGYKNFMCVESVAFDSVTLADGKSWSADLSLVPTAL